MAKLARHEELLAHVVDRLHAGWSLQQIAGRLRLDEASEANGKAVGRLCHETIYRHVYGPEGRTEQLHLLLAPGTASAGDAAWPQALGPGGHRIPQERGIACRPAEVATRHSFGYWEGDLLAFAKEVGNANVTTLLERRSGFLVLLANPDCRPAGVAERIGAGLSSLDASLRRTVTFDRGFEFMGYPALDRSLNVTSYFCDPRSRWQKGVVENANRRLRRYPTQLHPASRAADKLTVPS